MTHPAACPLRTVNCRPDDRCAKTAEQILATAKGPMGGRPLHGEQRPVPGPSACCVAQNSPCWRHWADYLRFETRCCCA
jgi:hypothetical protein